MTEARLGKITLTLKQERDEPIYTFRDFEYPGDYHFMEDYF